MYGIHESRIARAARAIAARLENQSEVRLTINSDYADAKVFRIMHYMNRYLGKYWIEHPGGNVEIVRKW